MFSFHKPRVYRSTEGCCICRAKSSSSRFTDSRKYEDDSRKCFNLSEPRQGEICNACVLLVKRFKRLPTGSSRHWGHVVDARIGPGMKSMSKFKKQRDDIVSHQQTIDGNVIEKAQKNIPTVIPEKYSKIFRKAKKIDKNVNTHNIQTKEILKMWEEQSPSTPESFNSDIDERTYLSKLIHNRVNRRKIKKPQKYNYSQRENISFIDENSWKLLKICCGLAYENSKFGALMIDMKSYKPCAKHSLVNQTQHAAAIAHSTKICQTTNIQYTGPHNNQKQQVEIFPISIPFGSNKIDSNNRSAFVQKIKSDTAGKIIKHSISKIEALPFVCSQPVVQPTTEAILKREKNINVINIKKCPTNNKIVFQNKRHTNLSATSTKFSDNSSDSGFDENLLDGKSTSPNQDHENIMDKKYPVRPVENIFLHNGIQIQGKPQDLILIGNDFSTKILEAKRQQYTVKNKK